MRQYSPQYSNAYNSEFQTQKIERHKHFTFEKSALALVMSLCLLIMATA